MAGRKVWIMWDWNDADALRWAVEADTKAQALDEFARLAPDAPIRRLLNKEEGYSIMDLEVVQAHPRIGTRGVRTHLRRPPRREPHAMLTDAELARAADHLPMFEER
jgi:hypothetical protein